MLNSIFYSLLYHIALSESFLHSRAQCWNLFFREEEDNDGVLSNVLVFTSLLLKVNSPQLRKGMRLMLEWIPLGSAEHTLENWC